MNYKTEIAKFYSKLRFMRTKINPISYPFLIDRLFIKREEKIYAFEGIKKLKNYYDNNIT
jgi:hypothetical protein